jgi:hypothetical protein
MTLRICLLSFTLFVSTISRAQETIVLNNQDGVFITYELTKIESSSKKDTYLAVVKAENKNDFAVFYGVPQTRLGNGTSQISPLENQLFAQSSVRNSTGLLGDNINLKGNSTKFITTDNKALFTIGKGSFVTGEKEFKVKGGVKPVLTNTFLFPLKPIENFDLAISEEVINGDWISSCGNIQMALTLSKNEKGEAVIQQQINGKQNSWRKLTSNTYEKVNDKSATLSYNKTNNTFNYSTTDGVVCSWNKKIKLQLTWGWGQRYKCLSSVFQFGFYSKVGRTFPDLPHSEKPPTLYAS